MVMYTDAVMASLIVGDIIDNLVGRRGLGNEWEQIDEHVQNEIKETWRKIILDYLPKRSQ